MRVKPFVSKYLDPAGRLGEILFGLIMVLTVTLTAGLTISYAPASWCKVGVVVDRTKAFGNNIDIRRGPLVGFKYKKVDFTTYWLSPGTRDATFIFTVTINF